VCSSDLFRQLLREFADGELVGEPDDNDVDAASSTRPLGSLYMQCVLTMEELARVTGRRLPKGETPLLFMLPKRKEH